MCVLCPTDKQPQESKAVTKSSSEYATSADFCAIFDQNTAGLYRLALLLTADTEKAERCFVSSLEDCHHASPVFREWAHSWAKRVLVKNAIAMIAPISRAESDVPKSAFKPLPGLDSYLSTVAQLRPFDRVVSVLTVLEKYSALDCALLLGCTPSQVNHARTFALQKLSLTAAIGLRGVDSLSTHAAVAQAAL